MYEELIRSCRACATGYVGNCDSCMFSGEDCYKQLHKASADAIEELTKDLERLKNYEMFWNKEAEEALRRFQVAVANKLRWIPVTERLPEPKFAREWYLVALESGCVKSLAYEKEGRTDNLFRPGWHETASPVTHWMPLPEPPKEET